MYNAVTGSMKYSFNRKMGNVLTLYFHQWEPGRFLPDSKAAAYTEYEKCDNVINRWKFLAIVK